MKSDVYTRVILTVIALCLVWICIGGVAPPVRAQASAVSPTPVVLVDSRGVPLITPEGLRVNVGGQTVPVLVRNDTLPIVLRSVERRGAWEAIQVDVVRQPPTAMPTP